MKKNLFLLSLLLAWIVLGGFPAFGQEGPISVKSATVTNQFPEGVQFQVAAETAAPAKIQEIRLEMRVYGSNRGAYAYLEFTPATAVEGKYLLRTAGAQHKPPGTLIEYFFIITDSEKRVLETPKETYLYLDNRFQWSSVASGGVEVYYYGPTQSRAEFILKASAGVGAKMGALLGIKPARTVRIVAYNNYQHMLGALPFQSATTQRELVTQGQAWYDYGILLMLGSDARADGIASHEMTHMVVAEATKDAFVTLPVWLNEGLAEHGNVNPGLSFDAALSQAISNNALIPLRHLQGMPGTSSEIIQLYGQGRAVVRFMIDTYGEEKLRQLFAAFNKGLRIDAALQSVYGFDQDGLDNAWRQSLGLPLVEPAPEVTEPRAPVTASPVETKPPSAPAKRSLFGCAAPASR